MSARRNVRSPFVTGHVPGFGDVQACDAQSRIYMVAKFTAEQCAAALKVPYLQVTVKQAIERRVRQIAVATAVDQGEKQ